LFCYFQVIKDHSNKWDHWPVNIFLPQLLHQG
jgi:hypothetical protein